MTHNLSNSAIAHLLRAKAAADTADKEDPAHEAAESPAAEQAEHASGGEEQQVPEAAEVPMLDGAMQGGEGGGEDISHLLSQLSPEELDQLATELSQEMQHAGGHPQHDEVSSLAQAIEQHLQQTPEASPEIQDPQKMAAFNFVKSASYIEGFLKEAVAQGAEVSQAVDLYDNALVTTIDQLKSAELKGDQHKLDVNHNGKIDGEDLKKLRAGQKPKKHSFDEKTAAYYEGVLERAADYGLTEQDAFACIKYAEAGAFAPFIEKLRAAMADAKGAGTEALAGLGNKAKELGSTVIDHAQAHPDHVLMAGLGGGALGAAGLSHLLNRQKATAPQQEEDVTDKLASDAYAHGLYSRAAEYGLTPKQAQAMLHKAGFDVNALLHGAADQAAPYLQAGQEKLHQIQDFAATQQHALAEALKNKHLQQLALVGATGVGLGGVGAHMLHNRKNKAIQQ